MRSMHKGWLFGILLMFLAMPVVPVDAADHKDEGDGEKKLKIHGQARVRLESLENFLDFQDSASSGDANDDEFTFWPYRIRLAVEGNFDRNVRGYIEFQNVGLFGDDDVLRVPDFPPLQDQEGDIEDVDVYQGWLELNDIGGSGFSVRVGRQEHTYGTQLLIGDANFYGGQVFDGVHATWETERVTVEPFYYKILENNQFFNGASSDANFFGVTADGAIGEHRGTAGGYVMTIQFLDGFPGSKIHTIGGHYRRLPSRDHAWDWNAEAAFQTGEINGGPPTGEDVSGNLFEGWLGYSWGDGVRQRVHAGVLMISGDSDPGDDDTESFILLFGDNHDWNRLGDTDFFSTNLFGIALVGSGTPTGIQDIYLGYKVKSANKKHKFFVALHQFTASEDVLLSGEDDLGQELDLRYGYRYSENVGFQIGIANLMAGDAMDVLIGAAADDVMRMWGQVNLWF